MTGNCEAKPFKHQFTDLLSPADMHISRKEKSQLPIVENWLEIQKLPVIIRIVIKGNIGFVHLVILFSLLTETGM